MENIQARIQLGSLIAIVALTFAFSACSSGPKKVQIVSNVPEKIEPMGPPLPYGPEPRENESVLEPYGPKPVEVRPVVLVLGPGLARGFAYAGVLRALHEAKIPIGAVVATEMGALIGSLYVISESISRFDWGLLKVKDDLFFDKSPLFAAFGGSRGSGERLEEFLQSQFREHELERSKLPVRILIHSLMTSEARVVDSGSYSRILRAALAVPGVVEPARFDGDSWSAAAESRPFPVREAKKLGIGPVIVVDVLDDPPPWQQATEEKSIAELMALAKKVGQDELKEADLILRPQLTGMSFTDFKRRSEMIFRGKSAVYSRLGEIRTLVRGDEQFMLDRE